MNKDMEKYEPDFFLQKLAILEDRLQKALAEKEKAEYELKKCKDSILKAENASKMKSLFLANMSHEIRTPLNAIEGFSRIIAETESMEERMQFLEIIESNNSRLGFLINEILDLSRVEAGEITIKKSHTDLDELCKSIKHIFKFKITECVKLMIDTPTESIMLNTDANRLTQVFSNLINNAIKHTKQGAITFGYRPVDNRNKIRFYVKDTGDGISSKDIDHIFQAYVSKDAETHYNSFGLGLPLSKIIIEKMGGQIYAESHIGKGSTFYFTLPFDGFFRNIKKMSTTTSVTRTLRMDANGGTNKMKLILIAEDEDCNYELLKKILSKRYRLIRARNGIEAVTLNEEETPDLILMDIRMPEMNGLDATRIIKEINMNIPVIALSAYAFDEQIKDAMSAGCNEFIPKPIHIEHLIKTIIKYLNE
ncbi:hybrid sensor histidine kinase/response regulator [Prevotella sp. MGM1]|nr:hybrid sensor histidine kinase/response regulator [Prevotella sp. MGM1]